jgi:hypothetical protein
MNTAVSRAKLELPKSHEGALNFQPPQWYVECAARDNGISEAEARSGFEELKKFLVVASYCTWMGGFAPNKRIDGLWHSFILFTREYTEFGALLGGYIHHIPTNIQVGGRITQWRYVNTVLALRAMFGEVNLDWWDAAAFIGGQPQPDLLGELSDQGLVDLVQTAHPKVSPEDIQEAADEFRAANQMFSAEETQNWLSAAGLSVSEFQQLLTWGIQARKLKAQLTVS